MKKSSISFILNKNHANNCVPEMTFTSNVDECKLFTDTFVDRNPDSNNYNRCKRRKVNRYRKTPKNFVLPNHGITTVLPSSPSKTIEKESYREKRQRYRKTDKQRRDQINSTLVQLSNVVNVKDIDERSRKKPTKLAILISTEQYIEELRETVRIMSRDLYFFNRRRDQAFSVEEAAKIERVNEKIRRIRQKKSV